LGIASLQADEPTHTKGPPTHASFPVGIYKLNDSIDALTGLVEFSPAEYETMRRQFVGEENYNAPPVIFLGRTWKLMLQTANGQICKIAPYIVVTAKQEATQLAMETLQFCNEQLGKSAEQQTGLFVWDTTDGNVVLQTGETDKGFCVSLFLTSLSIRDFKRITQPSNYPGGVLQRMQNVYVTNTRMQIVYVTNILTIVALVGLWITGHLSWSVGAALFTLWLLVPFGLAWSRPEGKPIWWRWIVSASAVGAISAIVGKSQDAMVGPLVFYVIASGGLAWLASKVRETKLASIYALIVNCGAAYSVGFSFEILLRELTGDIPGGQPWPVITWAVVGVTAFVIAGMAKPSGLLAAIPCWILAALAIMYGAGQNVAASTYGGVGMFLFGLLVLMLVPATKRMELRGKAKRARAIADLAQELER